MSTSGCNVTTGDVAWTIVSFIQSKSSSCLDTNSTNTFQVSTALVFLMTPGLGLFYSGLARTKNALSLMYLMMLAMAIVSIQW
jgi:hypothetical protein